MFDALPGHREVRARQQLVDALQDAARVGDAEQMEIVGQRRGIDLHRNPAIGQQRLHLGGE